MFQEYCETIGSRPKHTVWLDLEDDACFGADLNYHNSLPAETPFLTSEEEFLKDKRHGLPHFSFLRNSGYSPNALLASNEYICEDVETVKKYKDSSIFIIGAGPSIDMIDLKSVDCDYLWVCNDFKKHDTIKNMNISLNYMSSEVQPLEHSIEYMTENHDVSCCFDINVGRDVELIKKYKNLFDQRSFLFSTRLFTTIGTMPRLINLAALFGARNIKFVGMDGHPKSHYTNKKSYSAFESGWKSIPTGQSFGAQRREYVLFWEYMKRNYRNISFENLGSIYEHNVSKNILGNM